MVSESCLWEGPWPRCPPWATRQKGGGGGVETGKLTCRQELNHYHDVWGSISRFPVVVFGVASEPLPIST